MTSDNLLTIIQDHFNCHAVNLSNKPNAYDIDYIDFFDYFEKDGSLILLMGFDDKNGKGFTTPIQIPLYFYEGEALAKFTFAVKTSSYLGTVETVTNKDTEGVKSKFVCKFALA